MLRQNPENESLKQYICDQANRYSNVGLKAFWILNGYSKEQKYQKKQNPKIERLAQQIEMNLVNGKNKSSGMISDYSDPECIFILDII